jgi:hypothetical protein
MVSESVSMRWDVDFTRVILGPMRLSCFIGRRSGFVQSCGTVYSEYERSSLLSNDVGRAGGRENRRVVEDGRWEV